MGITGLLPFLEKSSRKVNITEFKYKTVAIDTYCWLHKGAFSCADKLARGEETDLHIKYCLKYINMLLDLNIKPILVFDGRHLSAKAQTEQKRRESRDTARKRAIELIRLGDRTQALSYFRRCVNITHEMALELIKECHTRQIDCIVAPYEADAQLAYLDKLNIADYIISEDSDLILFGCRNILFKLDLNGQATLIESSKLHLSMGCRLEKFTFDKFRYMCILSGCDYLSSLPGIGLAKACKFILKTAETNMERALKKIPSYLNMKQLIVTDEYIENFLKANATFLHMYVYDPIIRKLCRLNELSDYNTNMDLCCDAGELIDNDIAFQLALGNINPFTYKQLDNWNPDNCQSSAIDIKRKQSMSWNTNPSKKLTTKSIWDIDFKIKSTDLTIDSDTDDAIVEENAIKKLSYNHINKLSSVQQQQDYDEEEAAELEETTLLSTYATTSASPPPFKRTRLQSKISEEVQTGDSISNVNNEVLDNIRRNPFLKNSIVQFKPIVRSTSLSTVTLTPPTSSPSDLSSSSSDQPLETKSVLTACASPIKKLKLSKFKRTEIDQQSVNVISRFFKPLQSISSDNDVNGKIIVEDVSNSILMSPKQSTNDIDNNDNNNIDLNESIVIDEEKEQINITEDLLTKQDTDNKPKIDISSGQIIEKIALSLSPPVKRKLHLGLKKRKPISISSTTQSRLSMFGFQKKPQLS